MRLSVKLGQIGLGMAVFFLLAACAPAQGETAGGLNIDESGDGSNLDETAVGSTNDETASDLTVDETTVPPTRPLPDLPNMGEAPEITNETWINADAPITLASQRGNVVLLEFWTFG